MHFSTVQVNAMSSRGSSRFAGACSEEAGWLGAEGLATSLLCFEEVEAMARIFASRYPVLDGLVKGCRAHRREMLKNCERSMSV